MSIPFPAGPPGPPGAWLTPPLPGAPDAQTLYRPLSPEENRSRAHVQYWQSLRRVGVWGLLPLGALVLMFAALMPLGRGGGASAFPTILVVTVLVVVGLSLAIGAPIGLSVATSRAERELAPDRSLVTAWNQAGFTMAAPEGLRQVRYSDVRRVSRAGEQGWFVVFRLPLPWYSTQPHVLVLPQDLVPEGAITYLASRSNA